MRRCVMCKQEKPLDEVAFRSKATGQRQSHCRACHKAYRRAHYLKNRETYIRREVARIRQFRTENRIKIFEYLSRHPCIDCGETDVLVLEFDHRDPTTKVADIAWLASRKPWKFVANEITKCDVRCANCHRRRTAEQFGWHQHPMPVIPPVTGHLSGVPIQLSPNTGTRRCSQCGETKPLEAFSVKNQRTGRRSKQCRSCVAARSREHYTKYKATYLDRNRRNKRRYRRRNRARLSLLLEGKSCVDCGEPDTMVLEFDHRDGQEKEAAIARLVAHDSWDAIEAEIAKCDIRCANCHRRRTAVQFGWLKVALQKAALGITTISEDDVFYTIGSLAGVA